MSGRVLLGVTGSAAAFKGVAIASLLTKRGYDVDCILTPAGERFVGPVQLAAVTGRRTWTGMWADPRDHMPHISLARGADALVVAPATADILARMSCGLAGDLLPAVALAFSGPVIAAPSMNSVMWRSQANMENVGRLRRRGVVFVGPVEGRLACGSSGEGRMVEPEEVVEAVESVLNGGKAEE